MSIHRLIVTWNNRERVDEGEEVVRFLEIFR